MCGLVVVHILGAETPALPIVVGIVVATLAADVASVLLGRLRPLPAELIGPAGAHMGVKPLPHRAVRSGRRARHNPHGVYGGGVAHRDRDAISAQLGYLRDDARGLGIPHPAKGRCRRAVLNSSSGGSALRATVDPAIHRAD